MSTERLSRELPLRDFGLWKKYDSFGKLFSFDLELTARCNLNCRHCYINLPVFDEEAAARELTAAEISRIADEAVELGAVWCLLSGGEPLLRRDFAEIYLALKRKGLLLSVFTNGTAITDEHIELFRRYPPRDIEMTVYGVSEETYERVTRHKGAYGAFRRNLDRLYEAGVTVRLKAMALRSNFHEMPAIAEFCRERTKDFFRYDPNLHLRFDGDPGRNEQIRAERLTPEEVVELELQDPERSKALPDFCEKHVRPEFAERIDDRVFHCGVGNGNVVVGYDGMMRLCSTLHHPEYMHDLRRGTIREGLQRLVPKVQSLISSNAVFLRSCARCAVINLCQWCAAAAYLETGKLDEPVPVFCRTAHARDEAVRSRLTATSRDAVSQPATTSE